MVKEITPSRIRQFLSKRGPYVYYFNGECQGLNKDLVNHMHEFYKKIKDITFLEIKWKEYKQFRNIKSDEEMNYLYAYYNGLEKYCEKNPELKNLEIFFIKCIDLLQKTIEESIKNIGSRTLCNDRNLNNDRNDLIESKEKYELRWRRKCYIKKILNLQNNHFTYLYDVKNLNSSSPITSNWFDDVKYSDLLKNFLEDSSNLNSQLSFKKEHQHLNKNTIENHLPFSINHNIKINNINKTQNYNIYKSQFRDKTNDLKIKINSHKFMLKNKKCHSVSNKNEFEPEKYNGFKISYNYDIVNNSLYKVYLR